MYTSAREAFAELQRRREDPIVFARISNFLNGDIPKPFLNDRPIATLNRHLVTARREDFAFSQRAAEAGFQPFWLSYESDRFTVTNPDKVSLCRPRIVLPKGQQRRPWLVAERKDAEGKALRELTTSVTGEDGRPMSVPQFHKELRRKVMPEVADNTFDVSEWYSRQAASREGRTMAARYYPAAMALYVAGGVLFEDFDGGPNAYGLKKFVDEVVMPACELVEKEVGLSPLIVQLPAEPDFDVYPAETWDMMSPALERGMSR